MWLSSLSNPPNGRGGFRHHPGDYLWLALRKLDNFWAGMTLGFTGYNLPMGLSGKRGVADMVVPETGMCVSLWR